MPILAALLLAGAAPLPEHRQPGDIVVIAPRERAFAAPRVPDVLLARMRGGVSLPNGLTVQIGFDIQTRVDGVLALHTVYVSDSASGGGVRVFTDGTASIPSPAQASVATAGAAGTPALIVDRSPAGTTIIPGSDVQPVTVNLVNGPPDTWVNGQGQVAVPVTPNGGAVQAAPGAISLQSSPQGAVVTLEAPDLRVQQLIGQATGVIVANNGNNRAIDTVSAVNVDLQGITPALMSSVFAAERAAIQAAQSR